ncbi:alpha-N-methyltransferase NTM1 [Cladorrhinum sp. PSN259]|nr:alpha-N-methyltransferase NTM1 [Cladorrhinum sp. PSN259]
MSSSSATDYSPEITPLDSLISRQDSRSYWLNVEANIRGMTGGDLESSDTDLEGSAAFLRSLGFVISDCPLHKAGRVLEGGAGIGRVTLAVLVKVAQVVDVVEPIAKFTALLEGKPGIGHIFNVGIEDWNPVSGLKYDLIWNQWCATHLTDAQLVNYLCVCRSVLNLGKGVVVFKENITRGKDHVFDHADSSVTR